MSIKISIYDDNTSLLESLSYLIRGTHGFELYNISANANNIISNCQNLRPDVILMDIDMPGISGIEATMLVKNTFPEINVMILTVYEDRDKIFDALCAGATGYILKKSSSIEIIEAIQELHKGGSPMSSGIARKVLEYFSKPNITNSQDKYLLTTRELEILQRLVAGDSYKMLADYCCISIGTVYSHINNVYKKLQVNSKSEAVIKALKERLV